MNVQILQQFNLLLGQIEAEYLNARVEENLEDVKKHDFRLKSIKKIIGILKKFDTEIKTIDDVKGVPGIGKGTISRIAEILDTGHLSEIKSKYDAEKQQKIDGIQELSKIIGIGPVNARNLVLEHKITNVKEFKKAIKNGQIKVSKLVELGLKYYGIVLGNIPRTEITSIKKYLVKVAHQINPKLEIMICGSYRRGKLTSGDIDLLIYHPSLKSKLDIKQSSSDGTSFLEKFVDELTGENFLLDHLTYRDYSTKYMGFCQFASHPVRRIDIRFIPFDSLPAAMLYFTGPYELNTIMRNAAKRRKLILNEYGLYDDNDVSIPINSEADIFHQLNMDYLTPIERESYNTGKKSHSIAK